MTTKLVNPASFEVTEICTYGDSGTVEVTIQGKTRRLNAYVSGGVMTAYGLGVKYRTGTKVWSGSVRHYLSSGIEQVDGGFDNRATRSRIASIVGFYEDAAPAAQSQRAGTR